MTEAWVVCGAPAAGKSVLGAALARRLRAALLDQDVLTGPLTSVIARLVGAPPGDLDDPRVRAATRDATYEALLGVAADCLDVGVPVVLVAPFTAERSNADAWRGLSQRLQDRVVLVWASVPRGELMRRLARRDAPRDRRKLDDIEAFLASSALDPPVVPHISVDTTLTLADQVDLVLKETPGAHRHA